MKSNGNAETQIISAKIPKKYVEYIQKLLDWGIAPSQSEFIRTAIKNQISNDLKLIKNIEKLLAEDCDLEFIIHDNIIYKREVEIIDP